MSLQDTIADIQRRLKSREFANEDEITNKVVRRLLSEMGWDIFGDQVRGQYLVKNGPVKNGFVDLALLANENEPDIYIEVKQHGNLPRSGADEQIFGYAWHDNVPFLVVTDGQEWHFYLSRVGKGSDYENRKVYSLDLIKHDITASEDRLLRYFSYGRVANGDALKIAEADHEYAAEKREAKRNIPEAWSKLLDGKDAQLLELLSAKVREICKYDPKHEDVFAYLRGLKPGITSTLKPSAAKSTAHSATHYSKKTADYGSSKTKKPASTIKVIFPDGTEIYHPNAVDTLTDTFKEIGWEKVQSVNLQACGYPLVSQQQHREDWDSVGAGFFVYTATSTNHKVKQLREVNTRLSLGLKIEKKSK